MNQEQPISSLLDHALLHPTLTDDELRAGCELARELQAATVCVKPYAVQLAVEVLQGSETSVGTVIGFPHGSNATEIKAIEAELACRNGATEVDMVVNVGKVLQGDWDFVLNDIAAVTGVARNHEAIVKVIFETDFVTDDDAKRKLCQICEEVGVDFVKTSTGFGFTKQDGSYNYTGATAEDIKLMRATCGDSVGVKASGGIRSFEDAAKFRELGATRLGTSASKAIVEGAGTDDSSY